MNDRCFVIQPFDRGKFDKRFDDVLTPAISAAGLNPYRVDRDPAVVIPIDAIESGIRDSAAVLAEITTDNPNVWFELGYALACQKPLVLVCSAERGSRFPFDIQHRHVIVYQPESVSDFEKLGDDVEKRLRAVLAKEAELGSLSGSGIAATGGLKPHEVTALVVIGQNDMDEDSYPSIYVIKQDMTKAGFTELAAVLAIKSLQAQHLVIGVRVEQFQNEPYTGFRLTESGNAWLQDNSDNLSLRRSTSDDPPETYRPW